MIQQNPQRREFLKKSLYAAASLSLHSCNPLLKRSCSSTFGVAKSLVHIFYVGGPSQMELFDYKKELYKADGKKINSFKTEKSSTGGTLKAPISKFSQHGESGQWFSDLVPYLAKHADDLNFIKTYQNGSLNHLLAQKELLTGSSSGAGVTLGNWINYSLSSNKNNLPGEVILTDHRGIPRCFPHCIETKLNFNDKKIRAKSLQELDLLLSRIDSVSLEQSQVLVDTLKKLNTVNNSASLTEFEVKKEEGLKFLNKFKWDFQNSFRNTPLSLNERRIYRVGKFGENQWADKFIFTSRLLEKGLPFAQIMIGNEEDPTSWDHHFEINDIERMCKETDFYVAAFLSDLKSKGLHKDVLVWGAGEFGRTPFADIDDKPEGSSGWGRGHNNQAATMWMMGPGLKAGHSYGTTDEISLYSDRDPVKTADLWITFFHLLGISHDELVIKTTSGIKRPDIIHGELLKGILS